TNGLRGCGSRRSRPRMRSQPGRVETDGGSDSGIARGADSQEDSVACGDDSAGALGGGDGGVLADPPGAGRSDRADAGRGSDGRQRGDAAASASVGPAVGAAVLALHAWTVARRPGAVAAPA